MLNIQDYYSYKNNSVNKNNRISIHPLTNKSVDEYLSNNSHVNKYLDKINLLKSKNFKTNNFETNDYENNENNHFNQEENLKNNYNNSKNIINHDNMKTNLFNQLKDDGSFMKLTNRYNKLNNSKKNFPKIEGKKTKPLVDFKNLYITEGNYNNKFKNDEILNTNSNAPQNSLWNNSKNYPNIANQTNYINKNHQTNNNKKPLRSNSLDFIDHINKGKKTIKHDGFTLYTVPLIDEDFKMSDPKYSNFSHTNFYCKKIIHSLNLSNNLKIKDEAEKVNKITMRKINKTKNPKEYIEKLCDVENNRFEKIINNQTSKNFLENRQLPQIINEKKNIEIVNNFYNNGNGKFMGYNFNPFNYELMWSKNRTKRNVFGTLFNN